jgi:hypothetical protein
LAKSFGKNYKIPLLKIDEIIMEAIQFPEESVHHRVLNFLKNPVSQPSHGPDTARSLMTPPEQEKPKIPSLKLTSKMTKSSSQSLKVQLGDPSVQHDRLDPDLLFHPKQLSYQNSSLGEPSALTTCLIPDEILIPLIAARLYRQDCRRGAVFDGMKSDFLDSYPAAARVILAALENRKRILSFVLCNSFLDYRRRRQRQRVKRRDDSYAQIIRQMAAVRKLSESEYQAMRKSTRRKIDRTISLYVAAMRLKRQRALQPLPSRPVVVDRHLKEISLVSNFW